MSLREDLIDKRIVTRNLRKGLVAEKAYRGYMEALPDVSDKAEPLVPPGDQTSETRDETEREPT